MQYSKMTSELFMVFTRKHLVPEYQHKMPEKEFPKPCDRILVQGLRYIEPCNFSANAWHNSRNFNSHRQLAQTIGSELKHTKKHQL